MGVAQSPLLLDIDIDYVLDRRLPPCNTRDRTAECWLSGKRLFELLAAKNLPPVSHVEVFRDHASAFRLWHSMGLRSCPCVHIDAHSDLYASVIEPRRLLAEGYQPVSGNYLRFALATAIVREVILVPPRWFSLTEYLREDVIPYGYANDPRIRTSHLGDADFPDASCCVVTIATSPAYTPVWADCEAHALFRLFSGLKSHHV